MEKKIPERYREIVFKSMTASAAVAVGHDGILRGLDTVALSGIWSTMFYALRKKADSNFGADPKRIAFAVAMGIANYYNACKLASYVLWFLNPSSAMRVSWVYYVYPTYNFAASLIPLFESPKRYSDDDIIVEVVGLMKKLPSISEVTEIYNSWHESVYKIQ